MSARVMVGIVRIGSMTPARSTFRLVQSALGNDFSLSTSCSPFRRAFKV